MTEPCCTIIKITAYRKHLHKSMLPCIGFHRASGKVIIEPVFVLRFIEMEIPGFFCILRMCLLPGIRRMEHVAHLFHILLAVHIISTLHDLHKRTIHHFLGYLLEILYFDLSVSCFPDRHKYIAHIGIASHGIVRSDIIRFLQHFSVDRIGLPDPLSGLFLSVLTVHWLFHQPCQ